MFQSSPFHGQFGSRRIKTFPACVAALHRFRWQATVKELNGVLNAQGRTAKQDMEKRITELNGRVANWDGLINKTAEVLLRNCP